MVTFVDPRLALDELASFRRGDDARRSDHRFRSLRDTELALLYRLCARVGDAGGDVFSTLYDGWSRVDLRRRVHDGRTSVRLAHLCLALRRQPIVPILSVVREAL